MTDIKELKDEILDKVSGGNYAFSVSKPIGFSFYLSSDKTCVYKINSVIRKIDADNGFLYKIDRYYNNVYDIPHPDMSDKDIDDCIIVFGKPE